MSQKLLKQNNLSPFEFNRLYEFKINSEYVDLPTDTIQEIAKAILTDYIFRSPSAFETFPIHSFLGEIDWRWMTNRGSLPKRIDKWYKEVVGINLSQDTLSSIGNIARKIIVKNQEYYFDVVPTMSWPKGNFGDHGSCFMGFNPGDQTTITEAMSKDPRFAAIRFFKRNLNKFLRLKDNERENVYYAGDEWYYSGISRALMCFDSVTDTKRGREVEIPLTIVFNGYGLTTNQIAGIVASFLGMFAKRIQISNNNNVTGGLYVNDAGIVIGELSSINTLKSYDFGLKYGFESTSVAAGFSNKIKEIKDGDRMHGQVADKNSIINSVKKQTQDIYKTLSTYLDGKELGKEEANQDDGVLKYIPAEPVFRDVNIEMMWRILDRMDEVR